jgi:hypothetical protein
MLDSVLIVSAFKRHFNDLLELNNIYLNSTSSSFTWNSPYTFDKTD